MTQRYIIEIQTVNEDGTPFKYQYEVTSVANADHLSLAIMVLQEHRFAEKITGFSIFTETKHYELPENYDLHSL